MRVRSLFIRLKYRLHTFLPYHLTLVHEVEINWYLKKGLTFSVSVCAASSHLPSAKVAGRLRYFLFLPLSFWGCRRAPSPILFFPKVVF